MIPVRHLPAFLNNVTPKNRLTDFAADIPVHVIGNDKVDLMNGTQRPFETADINDTLSLGKSCTRPPEEMASGKQINQPLNRSIR